MLKRMAVTQLKPGMYVAEICRQTGHMQVRTEGLVRDQKAIDALAQLGIEEVLIDLTRQEPPIPAADSKKTAPTRSARHIVPFDHEINRAADIYQDAMALLETVLSAAPAGRPVPSAPLRNVVQHSMASLLRNPDAMMCLAHLRDKNRYLLEHAINSSVLMTVFARSISMPEEQVEALALGALWHDIGKTQVSEAILDKPGRLTAEESREMRRHVEYGLDIADTFPGISTIAREAIAQHHERLDGNGYPNKLRGDEISQAGRMMAIVDSYDALTGVRVYRGPVTAVRAFKVLRADSYALYDAELVMAFIKAIGLYPVGTLVKLKSQRLALVIATNPDKPYLPVVKVFYHGRFRQSLPIQDINLADPDCGDDIEAAVRPEQFKLDLLQFFRTVVAPS